MPRISKADYSTHFISFGYPCEVRGHTKSGTTELFMENVSVCTVQEFMPKRFAQCIADTYLTGVRDGTRIGKNTVRKEFRVLLGIGVSK